MMFKLTKGRRNGMRSIVLEIPDCLMDVISNAYGNGYVAEKPKNISDGEWQEIVAKAKILEQEWALVC